MVIIGSNGPFVPTLRFEQRVTNGAKLIPRECGPNISEQHIGLTINRWPVFLDHYSSNPIRCAIEGFRSIPLQIL